ncbi:MAG: hypothetical protein ACMUIL_04735 [bacterium]
MPRFISIIDQHLGKIKHINAGKRLVDMRKGLAAAFNGYPLIGECTAAAYPFPVFRKMTIGRER